MQNRFYSDPSSSWQAYYNWLAAQQQAEKDSPAGMASDIGNKVGNIGGKIAAKKGIGAITKALGGGAGGFGGSVGPLSESGLAGAQSQLGPLADFGLSSSSPASGAIAQMGGVSSEVAPTILGNASQLGAGPLAAIGMSTYLGGKAGYDMLKGKEPGVPGRVILGMATGGLSELAKPFLGSKSTKDIQAERWGGVGREDLADSMRGHDYFTGTGGEESRDESFLTPDAIRVNPENYGLIPQWDSLGKDRQNQFLQGLLDKKAVSERKGGIYYDDDVAKQLADAILAEPEKPAEPDAGSKLRWRQSDNALMRKYGYA